MDNTTKRIEYSGCVLAQVPPMSASAVVDLAAYRRSRQQAQVETVQAFPIVMVPVWMFVPVWLIRTGY